MAVSNEQVFNWLQANPNATDAEIAAVASAAGVSAQQLSEVTSVPVAQIEARLSATAPTIQLPQTPATSPVAAPEPETAPTPSPTTTWDWNKYIESLKSESTDYNASLGTLAAQDPTMAKNAQNIYKEILAQQKAGSDQ